VCQVISGEKRPAQACREYGIAESVLSHWRKEYHKHGEAAFQPQPSELPPSEAQRIAELERFCGQLTLENTALKKVCSPWDHAEAHHNHANASSLSPALDCAIVRPVWGEP